MQTLSPVADTTLQSYKCRSDGGIKAQVCPFAVNRSRFGLRYSRVRGRRQSKFLASSSTGGARNFYPSIRSEAPSFIVARAAKPPVFGAKHQTQNVFAAKRRKHSCLRYTGEARNAPQTRGATLHRGAEIRSPLTRCVAAGVTPACGGRPSSVFCFRINRKQNPPSPRGRLARHWRGATLHRGAEIRSPLARCVAAEVTPACGGRPSSATMFHICETSRHLPQGEGLHGIGAANYPAQGGRDLPHNLLQK